MWLTYSATGEKYFKVLNPKTEQKESEAVILSKI